MRLSSSVSGISIRLTGVQRAPNDASNLILVLFSPQKVNDIAKVTANQVTKIDPRKPSVQRVLPPGCGEVTAVKQKQCLGVQFVSITAHPRHLRNSPFLRDVDPHHLFGGTVGFQANLHATARRRRSRRCRQHARKDKGIKEWFKGDIQWQRQSNQN